MNKKITNIIIFSLLFLFVKCNNKDKSNQDKDFNRIIQKKILLNDTLKTDSILIDSSENIQKKKSLINDSTFIIDDSILNVVGIVQSTGMTDEYELNISADYQLITSKRPIFLISDSDLKKFWGQCVRVIGKFPKGWNINTEEFQNVWTWGRTAVTVDSISIISGCNCDIWNVGIPKTYDMGLMKDTIYGTIGRLIRPCPDIWYDYKIDLKYSIPHPIDTAYRINYLPIILDIEIDELNKLIEQKKEVKAIGFLEGGYAESLMFIANKIDKIQ